MRFSSWSVGALALTASLAVADPTDKTEKKAPKAAPSAQAAQADDQSGDDEAQPSDEKAETDAPNTKKGSSKGPGIKLVAEDEASLLKTLSYMQGYGVGKTVYDQFTQQGIELDEETLLSAFKDGLAGKQPEMSEEAMKKILPQVEKYINEKYIARARERGTKAKAEGEAFLTENKKKEGVKTLASGLQYKVLKKGNGETPKKSDTVRVHYKGTLLNGNEFGSSYKTGSPVQLQINRLIKGWAEALLLMKVGDKWQLFVPSDLAYEEKGNHDQAGHEIIPPNATLVYEVELLGIDSGRKATPPTLK